jgi:hypothetical protein
LKKTLHAGGFKSQIELARKIPFDAALDQARAESALRWRCDTRPAILDPADLQEALV